MMSSREGNNEFLRRFIVFKINKSVQFIDYAIIIENSFLFILELLLTRFCQGRIDLKEKKVNTI